MHDVAFRFKRAHLRAVAWHKWLIRSWCRDELRVPVDEIGLTPARLDAMVVIRSLGGCCLQSELWQRLGLHASTICKMLKRMELADLVERSPGLDRRERHVQLTKKGFDVLVGALQSFVRSNFIHDAYAGIHRRGADFIREAIDGLRCLAWGLGDSSTHEYFVGRWTEERTRDAEAWDADVRKDVERLERHRNPAVAEPDAGPPELFGNAYFAAYAADLAQGGAIAEAARARFREDANANLAAAAEPKKPEEEPALDIRSPEYWGKHHAEIAQGGTIAEAARERLRRDMANAYGT